MKKGNAELKFENVSIEREGKTVVNNVSLSVGEGETHIVMGPNGSGKSTFLNAVMGHPAYALTKGTITLDGEDITNLSTEKKAEKGLFLSMQYIPAVEGVTVHTFLHRAYRLLTGKEVSALDFYKRLEAGVAKHGLDVALLKRQVNVGFSGGEKKQAQVIELIALRPKFALLDEIDSGVDVDALGNVFRAIKMLRDEGMGFVIVTHLGAILKTITPNNVSVMKDGVVAREGGAELAREVLEKGFVAN